MAFNSIYKYTRNTQRCRMGSCIFEISNIQLTYLLPDIVGGIFIRFACKKNIQHSTKNDFFFFTKLIFRLDSDKIV